MDFSAETTVVLMDEDNKPISSATEFLDNVEQAKYPCRNLLTTSLKDGCLEPLALVAEFLGIALAASILEFLLREVLDYKRMSLSQANPNLQGSKKVALHRLVKGATERLRILALKSRGSEDKENQLTVVHAAMVEHVEALESERIQLLRKVAHAESQVNELKKRRTEDARANEKVVSMFATRETGWKKEKKKMKDELQKLRNKLQTSRKEQEAVLQISSTATSEREQGCDECAKKEMAVNELKDRLEEQELLMMATIEKEKVERQEKNELAGKAARADVVISELREKLAKEVEEGAAEFRKQQAVLAGLRSKQRHLEMEMSHMFEELESSKRDVGMVMEEKHRSEELMERMSLELSKQKEDIHEKEEMISAMIRKANADAEEKNELGSELATAKAKRNTAENEKEKWKRLVEERARSGGGKEMFRPRSSFGSRADSNVDVVSDLQRLHDNEVQNLQSIFDEQVKVLQKRLRLYQDRVTDLEESILQHMDESKQAFHVPRGEGGSAESGEVFALRQSLEADIAAKQFQLLVAKDLLVQYMDADRCKEQEVDKWKRLYIGAKATIGILQKENETAVTRGNPHIRHWSSMEKARYTAQLEQRHWQEIDAFERQMKANNDRMEAFRWQLLSMETEAQKRSDEIEALNKLLHSITEEKKKIEADLKKTEQKLSCKERANWQENVFTCQTWTDTVDEDKQSECEAQLLKGGIRNSKKFFRVRQVELESTMMKVVEKAEAELSEKDLKLAFVEAKLIQAQLQYEKQKKAKEKISFEMMKECISLKTFLTKYLSADEAGKGAIDAISTAWLKVEKLSNKITEAQEQLLQIEEQHELQLKELVEQASANGFKSSSQLRTLKDTLLSNEEMSNEKLEQVQSSMKVHHRQDEPTIDKYVSDVELVGLPLRMSASRPLNLLKLMGVVGETRKRGFQSDALKMEDGGDQRLNKFVRSESFAKLTNQVDSKNVQLELEGDVGTGNALQEITQAFEKLSLARDR